MTLTDGDAVVTSWLIMTVLTLTDSETVNQVCSCDCESCSPSVTGRPFTVGDRRHGHRWPHPVITHQAGYSGFRRTDRRSETAGESESVIADRTRD